MNNQQRLNVPGQTRDHGIIGLNRSTHWLALADHHGVNINKQRAHVYDKETNTCMYRPTSLYSLHARLPISSKHYGLLVSPIQRVS